MQNSNSRIGISDVTQKTSPSSARQTRPVGSPRSPASELQKKRAAKVSDLETQLAQTQEELKKTKEILCSAEQDKRRAIQEAEAVKKLYLALVSKLEEKQRELVEFSASEDARIQELRRLSQERDRAWQSELQAVQRQSSVDAAALASAINEIHRLRLQLERAQVKKVEIEEAKYRRTLELSMEWVNSVVEEAGMMVLEGQVLRTVETESARELAKQVKADSELREAEMAAALTKKEAELRRVSGLKKEEETEAEQVKADYELREAELRKLKIQSEQWRKAAEAAAAMLSSGNQSNIMDSPYSYLGGKLMGSPFDEDADVGSPRRKNTTVLRKLGFWMKGQK
ncbi:interactor of constitutive active ROPs 5-like isoform X2 [Wolffia australiana]